MSATLSALHEEHQHLLPHIDDLRSTAARIGNVGPAKLADSLDRASDFLKNHLIPHARAEDDVLYELVAQVLGSEDATSTMKRDHLEVVRLTGELSRFLDRRRE